MLSHYRANETSKPTSKTTPTAISALPICGDSPSRVTPTAVSTIPITNKKLPDDCGDNLEYYVENKLKNIINHTGIDTSITYFIE